MNNIYKLIDKKQVVSFDIFDTLLLRPFVKPADLFVYIEQITKKTGFATARQNAESLFYNKFGYSKEANIDDIYSVMPAEYAELKDLELNLEKAGLKINPEVKKIYDYAIEKGKTVIIASDMYLRLDFIKSVLKANGITNYNSIYLSNELNKRKDRGDMYNYIIEDLKVSPSQILHIGDNRTSDFEQAKKHKITPYLYTKVVDRFLNNAPKRFRKFYKAYKNHVFVSILTALIAQKKVNDDYWYNFGYDIAGAIVYSYTRWIYNISNEENIKNILFVARDGYIAQKVFNIFNSSKIKTSYVYAPRILNYTANLDYDPKLQEQPRIVCEYFKQDTGNLPPHQFIEENIDKFEKLAQQEKKNTGYSEYIKEIVGKDKTVGVVDTISGQLSGQKLIEKEAGIKTHGFYMMTIPGRSILNEMRHHDYYKSSLRDIFSQNKKCDIIELIFSAPENPIITLHKQKPIYKEDISVSERIRQKIHTRMEPGILDFAEDINNRLAGNDVCIENYVILELLNHYVKYPAQKDITAMFDVTISPYADNSLYVPLFSAPISFWKISKTKKLLWRTPIQEFFIILLNPIKIKMRGLKRLSIVFFPALKNSIFNISLFNRYRISIGEDANA